MAIIKRSAGISGAWVKGSEVKDGVSITLVNEADFIPSKFDDTKQQLTAKCRIGSETEIKNLNINKPSQNALVLAFGEESKEWINKPLTARTEKVVVSGKRVVAVYLVPEGYEMSEDDAGFVVIKKIGEKQPEIDKAALDEIFPDEGETVE